MNAYLHWGKKGLGALCLRLYGTGLYPVLRGAVQECEA